MVSEILIARQPILDKEQILVAYELLFRKKVDGVGIASIVDDMTATAQVLDNALNNVGVEKLVGKNLAFINCSYELLTSDILNLLNPEIFVIEILETVNIDDKIVEAVKGFKEKGYKIAVDDFVPKSKEYKRIIPLLPYTDIVKIEYPATTIKEIEKAVIFFHSKNIQVLSEKVETEQDFKDCLKAGCDLFQGYFFSKPETISENKVDSDVAGTFEIIKAINSDLEIEQIEGMFKSHPQLSVNLIKYLNSAAFATRMQITSIKHAISLLGYSSLKRWLLILAYANKATVFSKSPLVSSALYRAAFFESVAKAIDLEKTAIEKAYLTGLVSNLSALYKIPLEIMLSQVSLDSEINDALLHKKGKLGEILELDHYLEIDDIKNSGKIMEQLGLSMEALSSCMLKAYEVSQAKED
ncbi:MAG: EAL domain-containing protein [Fibromonadaceae bacterium]|jgi:EAL and modified HD-GYP domain-containing signal transduction protein|nr:EAL domain-containing protein [Fibromonadaceae bacterium]